MKKWFEKYKFILIGAIIGVILASAGKVYTEKSRSTHITNKDLKYTYHIDMVYEDDKGKVVQSSTDLKSNIEKSYNEAVLGFAREKIKDENLHWVLILKVCGDKK